MITDQAVETAFYMYFYKLKKFCDDSAFKVERTVDEKNFDIFSLLQANSFELNEYIQTEIKGLIVLERQVEIFKTISLQVKIVVNNQQKFPTFNREFPKVLETILWLARKFKTTHYIMEMREVLRNAYGDKNLAYLEQFSNVNLEDFEKQFEADISLGDLKQKVLQIKMLYLSQELDKSQPFQAEFPSQNNNQPKVVPNGKSPKPNNRYEEYNQSKQEYDLLNRSNAFDFNKNKNNLQISVVKGLKKDNIEFYDQIEPALRASGDLFTDDTFPPEISSLTSNVNKFPIANKVVWRRISEVYKRKNIKLCSDQIGPNDIHQGQLGDCYFLSALSVLAEKKHFIKRLFHSKDITSTGCYSVWLCDSGEWKNIIIDDFIPCINHDFPCFSRSKGNDIWVLLLEKAFAKLYGNYYNIDGGDMAEALSALTGAPTKYFAHKENNGILPLEQIWLFVKGCMDNNFIITAASNGESQILNNKNMGIVSNHAYAVLDAQEIEIFPGQKERLIKIRNPWGTTKWKGAWGDDSPNWTPEIRRQLNFHSKNEDGIFWMNILDFDTYFDSICSCETHDDYYFSFLKLGENKKQNCFVAKMTTEADGFVYLTVQQKMKKHFRKNMNYDYSFIRVFLAKLDQNGQIASLIHGKYKSRQSTVIKKHIKKGNYLVFIEADWTQKIYNELNLTGYSKVKIDMQEEPLSNYNIPVLYESLLKAYIYHSGDKKIKMRQYENGGRKFQTFQYKIDRFGLVTVLIVNREKDIVLHDRLILSNLQNMEIYMPIDSNGACIDLHAFGGQEKMAIIKASLMNRRNTMYSYQYSNIHKLTQNFTVEQLKQLCKEKGQKSQTLKNGQIEVFSFEYLGGCADYFVNRSSNTFLQEEITFDTYNMLINGGEPKTLEIFVPPGEDFLVDMRIKNVFEMTRTSRNWKSFMLE